MPDEELLQHIQSLRKFYPKSGKVARVLAPLSADLKKGKVRATTTKSARALLKQIGEDRSMLHRTIATALDQLGA